MRQSAFRLVESRVYHFGASTIAWLWRKGRAGEAPVPAAVAFHVMVEMFCSFHCFEERPVNTRPNRFVIGSVRSKSKPGFTRGS